MRNLKMRKLILCIIITVSMGFTIPVDSVVVRDLRSKGLENIEVERISCTYSTVIDTAIYYYTITPNLNILVLKYSGTTGKSDSFVIPVDSVRNYEYLEEEH